jgi:hypothetical protein
VLAGKEQAAKRLAFVTGNGGELTWGITGVAALGQRV